MNLEWIEQPELAPDLEWMLQNPETPDAQLAGVLIKELYAPLYRFCLVLVGDEQAAFNLTSNALRKAVHERHRFGNGLSVRAWVFRFAWMESQGKREHRQAWTPVMAKALLRQTFAWEADEAESVASRKPQKNKARNDNQSQDNRERSELPAHQAEFLRVRTALLADVEELSDAERATVQRFVLQLSSETRQRRRFSWQAQSLTAAILLVALLGFTIQRARTETPPPVPTTVKIVEVAVDVVVEVTPTPAPSITPSPTATAGAPTPISIQDYQGVHSLDFKPVSAALPANSEKLTPGNSGAAALALVLRYWGEGDNFLSLEQIFHPNPDDPAIMFSELENYAARKSGLDAAFRLGGTPEILQKLLVNGLPVIVMLEADGADGWQGRYEVLSGYDFTNEQFQLAIPYSPADGSALRTISLQDFTEQWRLFNYAYLVIYPVTAVRPYEPLVISALGPAWNEFESYTAAYNRAQGQIYRLVGRDLFIAQFNSAASLTYLQDYIGAAQQFDEALQTFDALPEEERPWRMLWYSTRPYWAYYYTGQYQKVIDLANEVIKKAGDTPPEESYYWRGLAKEMLVDLDGAKADLQYSLQLNPQFEAGKIQLERIEGKSK